jgi:hypothetical protein
LSSIVVVAVASIAALSVSVAIYFGGSIRMYWVAGLIALNLASWLEFSKIASWKTQG